MEQAPRLQLGATYTCGRSTPAPYLTLFPGQRGGSSWGYPPGDPPSPWSLAPMSVVCAPLRSGRGFPKPIPESEGSRREPRNAMTAHSTTQLQRPRRKLAAGAPRRGPAGAPENIPAPVPKVLCSGPERSKDLWVSTVSGVAAPRSTHLGASPPSAPAAPAAGRHSPTPGPGPAPRAPPWVPPTGASEIRPRTFSGPSEATASVDPVGVRATPSAAGRCARGPPRVPEPRPAQRAERPGAGPQRGAGLGVAEPRRPRRLRTLSAFARVPVVPRRHPECRPEGWEGQEEPGQGCPWALARVAQLPAPSLRARAAACGLDSDAGARAG